MVQRGERVHLSCTPSLGRSASIAFGIDRRETLCDSAAYRFTTYSPQSFLNLSFGINRDLAIVNSGKPFVLNSTRVNDDLPTLSLGTNYAHTSALRAGNSRHCRLSRP